MMDNINKFLTNMSSWEDNDQNYKKRMLNFGHLNY